VAFNAEVRAQRDLLFPVVLHLIEWRDAMDRFHSTAYKYDAKQAVDAAMEKLNVALEAAKPVIEKLKRG
jgi:hypothetical protein